MTRKTFILEILLAAAALATIAIAYPRLPPSIPVHWDLAGHPNRFGPPWALFLLGPGVMALIILLTWLLPWLSPKNFQIEAFRATYGQIMLMVFGLMAYISALITWSALGHALDTGRDLIGGVCLLLALMGNVMGKVRRNFFIGIRTPWTLANERVWNATHRFAAKTFVAGGLLGLVLAVAGLQPWPTYVLLAGALAPVLYSLVYYKQLQRRGEL